jgi:hypothetical protein
MMMMMDAFDTISTTTNRQIVFFDRLFARKSVCRFCGTTTPSLPLFDDDTFARIKARARERVCQSARVRDHPKKPLTRFSFFFLKMTARARLNAPPTTYRRAKC